MCKVRLLFIWTSYIKITEIEDNGKNLDLLNNLLDNNKNIENESRNFYLLALKLLGKMRHLYTTFIYFNSCDLK